MHYLIASALALWVALCLVFKPKIIPLVFLSFGVYQAYFPHIYDPKLHAVMEHFLRARAFECVVYMMAMAALYAIVKREMIPNLLVAFSFAFALGPVADFPLLTSNISLEGSICALLASYYVAKEQWPLAFAMTVSAILSLSSTSVLILVLTATVYTTSKVKKMWQVIAIWTLVLSGAFFAGRELFNDNGRFYFWRKAFNFVLDKNPIFGVGLGSYQVYGPYWEIHNKEPNWIVGIFPQLHNEWLQVFFETGTIGLLVFAIGYIILIFDSFKNNLFSVVLSLGVLFTLQMPLHHGPVLILLVLLLKELYGTKEKSVQLLQP